MYWIALPVLIVAGTAIFAATRSSTTPLQADAQATLVRQQTPKASLAPAAQPTKPVASGIAQGPSTPAPSATDPHDPDNLVRPREDNGCSLDTIPLENEYRDKLQQAKKELDAQLSFPVGMSISSKFVAAYNKLASALYTEYSTRATNAHCGFAPQQPEPLPATYPY